ncbi:PAS domain-containing protein [Chryseosolibacter indicus]|uniref:PAS domain-containing protein n=1 Tax=Chryseosolibacter indicus TaxID=2782351 RepID=A0ABS5VT18_9BACT|nr:PAS domain-containing protein [Chryseosolibacter indicus]MBT1703909.1 PAS domain-containing protein [Chryseosolibacter indicus]
MEKHEYPSFKDKFLMVKSNSFKYSLAYLGCFLGFSLIAIAIVVDIVISKASFNLQNIARLYETNPVHWIILTSPFFLTALFFIMGKMITERELRIDQQLEKEKRQLTLLEQFINALENERFDTSVSSSFDNKKLAGQLESFRDKLYEGKITEERRLWENQGLASFGDLLRRFNGTEKLEDEVIRFLVKYLSCNQGSLFLLNENNSELLQLKACYAFDKKKYVSGCIAVGQGQVGQCFLEGETIYLLDVPQNYIKITSGLGTANPNCIVIVPVKYNEQVTGVIEVASFTKLDNNQVKFLEKCAEAFASVIQSARMNQNVKQLLNESQQQTEELRSQEEEMRQNMEELQATQEQISRQMEENNQVKLLLEARERVLALTTILSESDLYGTITYINPKFTEVSQYRPEELIGKGHNKVRHPDMPKELFKIMWSRIKKGEIFRGVVKNRKKDGGHYWVDAVIVPVFQDGKIIKYIGARYHIIDDMLAEKLYEKQLIALGIESNLILQD